MELKLFQDCFGKFVYTKYPKGKSERWIEECLVGDDKKIEIGLKVYRNNLFATLVDVLSENFPCTRKILTDEQFFCAVKEFIYSAPSEHYDLNAYGELFPEFLSTYLNESKARTLSDLAKLEWTWEACYGLEDDQSMSFEQIIAYISRYGDDSIFRLRESALVFKTRFNVFQIWQQCRNDNVCEDFKEMSHTQYYLIWKDNFKRHARLIERKLLLAFTMFQGGVTLGEVQMRLDIEEKGQQQLIECIQVMARRGWFAQQSIQP